MEGTLVLSTNTAVMCVKDISMSCTCSTLTSTSWFRTSVKKMHASAMKRVALLATEVQQYMQQSATEKADLSCAIHSLNCYFSDLQSQVLALQSAASGNSEFRNPLRNAVQCASQGADLTPRLDIASGCAIDARGSLSYDREPLGHHAASGGSILHGPRPGMGTYGIGLEERACIGDGEGVNRSAGRGEFARWRSGDGATGLEQGLQRERGTLGESFDNLFLFFVQFIFYQST
jgi:hypothetical protein